MAVSRVIHGCGGLQLPLLCDPTWVGSSVRPGLQSQTSPSTLCQRWFLSRALSSVHQAINEQLPPILSPVPALFILFGFQIFFLDPDSYCSFLSLPGLQCGPLSHTYLCWPCLQLGAQGVLFPRLLLTLWPESLRHCFRLLLQINSYPLLSQHPYNHFVGSFPLC